MNVNVLRSMIIIGLAPCALMSASTLKIAQPTERTPLVQRQPAEQPPAYVPRQDRCDGLLTCIRKSLCIGIVKRRDGSSGCYWPGCTLHCGIVICGFCSSSFGEVKERKHCCTSSTCSSPNDACFDILCGKNAQVTNNVCCGCSCTGCPCDCP